MGMSFIAMRDREDACERLVEEFGCIVSLHQ